MFNFDSPSIHINRNLIKWNHSVSQILLWKKHEKEEAEEKSRIKTERRLKVKERPEEVQ